MLGYEISDKAREAFAPHHRIVQGAIAVLANRSLGVEAAPRAIGEFGGGVVVNGHEVLIKADRVLGGAAREAEGETPEEAAVVAAIAEIERRWEAMEFSSLLPHAYTGLGDPLRAMLGVR